MDVPVVLEHDAWRFQSSSSLLASYEELYPCRRRPRAPLPAPSAPRRRPLAPSFAQ